MFGLRFSTTLTTVTVFFLSVLFMAAPVHAENVFTDVDTNSKYYKALKYLKENEVLGGYPDGSFQPDTIVNRAEALKMITLAAGIPLDQVGDDLPFPDMTEGAWYLPYILTAVNAKMVEGYPDGTFLPGKPINRVEALKITYSAFAVDTSKVNVAGDPFPDVPNNDDNQWFIRYVQYAKNTNILEPVTLSNFEPATGMRRGDIAEMIYRILYLRENDLVRFSSDPQGAISYYADAFEGAQTAFGEVLRQGNFTAAHKDYPYGTLLQVMDFETDMSVIVKVNDRGPFTPGRIVDLTSSAFDSISRISKGVTEGAVRNVGENPDFDKHYFHKGRFTGITLDKDFPSIFTTDEVYVFKGSVERVVDTVTAFYTDDQGEEHRFKTKVTNNRFELPVTFHEVGDHTLTMIPGESGAGIAAQILVIHPFATTKALSDTVAPIALKTSHKNNEVHFEWSDSKNNLFHLVFYQGDTQVSRFINGSKKYVANPLDFEDFSEGQVSWYVEGAKTSTGFSHDRYTSWARSGHQSFEGVIFHPAAYDTSRIFIEQEPLNITVGGTLEIRGKLLEPMREKVFITMPSGLVEEHTLFSTLQANNGIVPGSTTFQVSVPTPENGPYIVEINNEDYSPALNKAYYPPNLYPVIPNGHQLAGKATASMTASEVKQNSMLDMINEERKDHGLDILVLDGNMSTMAQDRANDLVARNYFSHTTPEGVDVNDLRVNYGITSLLAENLAMDRNEAQAFQGLMGSPGHRRNILGEDYAKTGLGFATNSDGQLIVVQLFAGRDLADSTSTALQKEVIGYINDARSTDLLEDGVLNTISQEWAEKMVLENFFDIQNGTPPSLTDKIQAQSIHQSVKIFVLSSTNIELLKQKIVESTNVVDSTYTKIGVGLEQGNDGLIKATVLYY